MRIKNALVSVSDKSGLKELATALAAARVDLYSTGGSAAALRDFGFPVTDISALTGFGEILDGRVKTLHPHIHAAILADTSNAAHRAELRRLGVPKLDLVAVNFYPFERAAGESEAAAVENIDIGGVAMARAAAKNHACTLALTRPDDYPLFIGELKRGGGVFTAEQRRQWATRAFIAVAHTDAAIANYFSSLSEKCLFPANRFFHFEKMLDLSYGENPHQAAACYGVTASGISGLAQLQGPPVSYNNLLDAYSACLAVNMHEAPAAAVVKHNNPCGVAVADALPDALRRAQQADGISAYGGTVAFNRPLDGDTAALLQESFWEVVCAPRLDEAAKRALAVKERVRVLLSSLFTGHQRGITGTDRMLLVQTPDEIAGDGDGEVVSKRQPSAAERRDLAFAWRVAAAVKSNAIVIAKDGATLGIGAGQMSRVDSAWLAREKAKKAKRNLKNSVAASDGFFPFADGIDVLAKAGVRAVIQPGGSKNDGAVIAAADKAGLAMIFSGRRHFRH